MRNVLSATTTDATGNDARRGLGLAVCSRRWSALKPRLAALGAGVRWLALDCLADSVPARSPLLLDTVGLASDELLTILRTLAHARLTSLVVCASDDRRAIVLASLCAAVPLLLSDALPPPAWDAAIRLGTCLPPRAGVAPVVTVGLPTPPHIAVPDVLDILAACGATTWAAVLYATGLSRATLTRRLAALREHVDLPVSRFQTPGEFRDAVLAAIGRPDICEGTPC